MTTALIEVEIKHLLKKMEIDGVKNNFPGLGLGVSSHAPPPVHAINAASIIQRPKGNPGALRLLTESYPDACQECFDEAGHFPLARKR